MGTTGRVPLLSVLLSLVVVKQVLVAVPVTLVMSGLQTTTSAILMMLLSVVASLLLVAVLLVIILCKWQSPVLHGLALSAQLVVTALVVAMVDSLVYRALTIQVDSPPSQERRMVISVFPQATHVTLVIASVAVVVYSVLTVWAPRSTRTLVIACALQATISQVAIQPYVRPAL